MLVIQETEEFNLWLKELRDPKARAQVAIRITRARLGNFGDHKPVGEGVNEMRIDCGPRYRIYYKRKGDVVYVLLTGGDKKSQQSDIKKAIELANSI